MTTTAQANGCEFVNLTNIPEGVLKSVNAAIARIGNAIGTDGMPAKAPDGILPPKWKAIRGQQEKVMGDVRDVMCDRAIERFWDVISSESKAIAEQMSHIRACNSVRVPVVDREEAWSAVHTAACKAARSGPLANYAILFALSKLVEDRSFEGKDHYTKYVDMC
jgi:hypothetical protein